MRSQALEDLFTNELEEIYDAEKQIYKGLGYMAKAAHNSALKSAFQTHQKQTKQQIQRLEKAFQLLGESAERGSAAGVAGLIRQTKELTAKGKFDPAVLDAGLITSAQKIEHYEIAAYGCIRTHAGILGYKEIEDLLAETLKEEEATDALLTKIAESGVNVTAAGAPYSQARTGVRHEGGHALERGSASAGVSLGKIALGLALGGAVSVLFAPKSGKQTREMIRARLNPDDGRPLSY